jgi:hypothetical protein
MMNQMAAMSDGDDELDELERQFQQASTFARTGIKVRSPTEMMMLFTLPLDLGTCPWSMSTLDPPCSTRPHGTTVATVA